MNDEWKPLTYKALQKIKKKVKNVVRGYEGYELIEKNGEFAIIPVKRLSEFLDKGFDTKVGITYTSLTGVDKIIGWALENRGKFTLYSENSLLLSVDFRKGKMMGEFEFKILKWKLGRITQKSITDKLIWG